MMGMGNSEQQALTKIAKLMRSARHRYTYFITGSPKTGYTWQLVAPDDTTLCSSERFANLTACRKSLHAVQRHGATKDVRNDSR